MHMTLRRSAPARLLALLLAGLVLLTGCAATPEPEDEEHPGGMTARGAIVQFYESLASQDADALQALLGPHVPVDSVLLPDTAPELAEIIGGEEPNPRPSDDKYRVIDVTHTIGEDTAEWQAVVRYVEYDGGEPHWEIVNATQPFRTPEAGELALDIPEEALLPEDDSLPAGSDPLTGPAALALPGTHEFELVAANPALAVAGEPIAVPVTPGDASGIHSALADGIEGAALELSEAGAALVQDEVDAIHERCSNWCSEPEPNRFEAADWAGMSEDTGIFMIAAKDRADLIPLLDESGYGDWQSDIDEAGGADAWDAFVEVSPLTINYSTSECSDGGSSTTCHESNDPELPIVVDTVQFLFAIADDRVELIGVAGNTA